MPRPGARGVGPNGSVDVALERDARRLCRRRRRDLPDVLSPNNEPAAASANVTSCGSTAARHCGAPRRLALAVATGLSVWAPRPPAALRPRSTLDGAVAALARGHGESDRRSTNRDLVAANAVAAARSSTPVMTPTSSPSDHADSAPGDRLLLGSVGAQVPLHACESVAVVPAAIANDTDLPDTSSARSSP